MSNADASIDYQKSYEIASTDKHSGNANLPATSTSIHEKTIPWFAAEVLDHLYGSIYSTLDQFQLEDELGDASTYISKQRDEIAALLIFRCNGNIVSVLNQLITLDASELQRFADTLFAEDSSLSAISLTAVRSDTSKLQYPHQRFPFTEDIVATLPLSPDALLSQLGRNMRDTVKRYTNKVKKTFPTFRFETYIDRDICEAHAHELFRLHQERMHIKAQHSHLGEQEFLNILELARRRGMMTVAMIDGAVCGGLICWRVDRQYFMRIIAHDPRYDDYKIGSICCYLSMRECIARGGAEFHFLFGRMPYKYRFLGTGRIFDRIVIYRSHLAMLRHWRLAGQTMLNGWNQATRLWLQDAEHKNDWAARSTMAAIRTWRRVKQFRKKTNLTAQTIS